MKLPDVETFSLSNFEGPLDFLWHLINREEVDIYEISLLEITHQYLKKNEALSSQALNQGAEFIALIAAMLCLKSKKLLPQHEQVEETNVEEDIDPQFDIIHQLADYCHFKKAAKKLAERESQQSAFYLRGVNTEIDLKKSLGIAHLSIEDLGTLFKEILAKTSQKRGVIQEDVCKVSDIIRILRKRLIEEKNLPFMLVFTPEKSRIELIVTFLALLELMKSGEARVITDEKNTICILATH